MHKRIKLPSVRVRMAVEDYFEKNRISRQFAVRADVLLALVRINTPETRAAAETLLGMKVSPLPPMWARENRTPRVSVIRERSYGRSKRTMPTKTEKRFNLIRVGMTRDQIVKKGVPPRDVSRWTKSGNIVWSNR